MLTKVEITLKTPPDIKINPSMGSLFQGVLMQHLTSEQAETLHRQGLRPYSQSVRYDHIKQQPVWTLTALNQQAWETIILPILSTDTITIQHRNCQIQLQEKTIHQTTYQQLADHTFTNLDQITAINIDLLTPTTFKTNDRYAIYPEPKHIYQNLHCRWQAYAPRISLEQEHIIEQLADHTWITNYKLQMNRFHLEQHAIPAFSGTLRLALKGPDMLKRIAALLLQYANFSGIGIKTAIGMGCTQTHIIEKNNTHRN